MDGQGHFLSLKVMRVSRPALTPAWEPFYSSSPAFSAHSTESITSLQTDKPLQGHPKTLRDLTHASELLTLPSSFGSIVLGETFASCLCINNEVDVEIEAVSVRVEMQTATTKIVLGEFGGSSFNLAASDTLEKLVKHEIKELGQHVLACLVYYRLPSIARHVPGSAEDPKDEKLQTFRKFYKFMVTNPLSVKTKVHLPRSPTALLDQEERAKVYLEVHIQNLTPDPLWFEKLFLEPAEGWRVIHGNPEEIDNDIFKGAMALIQPQDLRQYVYTLSPLTPPLLSPLQIPGTSVALGRLDIMWRSSFGEPGRLLTSMLSRRIPPLAPGAGPSAIPPYLQRSHAQPGRPGSPRIMSPNASRTTLHPQSTTTSRPTSPLTALGPPIINIDLLVKRLPHQDIWKGKPFDIDLTLVVSSIAPRPTAEGKRKARYLSFAIQRIHYVPNQVVAAEVSAPETFAARLSSALSSMTASPTGTPPRGTFNFDASAVALEKTVAQLENQTNGHSVPPPEVGTDDESLIARTSGITSLGSSLIILPPILLSTDDESASIPQLATQDFVLSCFPARTGLQQISGVKVFLLDDQVIDDGETSVSGGLPSPEIAILREWDIIGEVYVKK